MPNEVKYSPTLLSIIDMTYMMAIDDQLEFITPEMVLDALTPLFPDIKSRLVL